MSFPNSGNGPFSASFKWQVWSASNSSVIAKKLFSEYNERVDRCSAEVFPCRPISTSELCRRFFFLSVFFP